MKISAILLLTLGFWANFLCCCEGDGCAQVAMAEQVTSSTGCETSAKAASPSCHASPAETVVEKTSNSGPSINKTCQCEKHQLSLTDVIMVPKAATQVPTVPMRLFLEPWMIVFAGDHHELVDPLFLGLENLQIRDRPSLSALSRFLI